MLAAVGGFPIYFGKPDPGVGMSLSAPYDVVDAAGVRVAVEAGD